VPTNVRLVHEFGGPEKDCPIEKRGSVLVVKFGEVAGWYRVDQQTGYVMAKKGGPTRWQVHPDDFKHFKQDVKQKRRRF
jgi:hypothetical protein